MDYRGSANARASVSSVAILFTIGAALSGFGLAHAAPSQATVKTAQFSVESGGVGEGSVECDPAKRVVGGGIVQIGSAEGAQLIASGPRDETGDPLQTKDGDTAKQWYAAIWNNGDAEQSYKVFALCSSTSDATVEVSQFKVRASTGAFDIPFNEGFAKCSGSKRALGGGIIPVGEPSSTLSVAASGPIDKTGKIRETKDGDKPKQWYAAARNISNAERTFRVFSLCSSASSATIEQTQFTDGGEFNVKKVACGGNKRATGGGVVQIGSAFSVTLAASGPLDASGKVLQTEDGDKATQWYGAARADFGGEHNFRVLVICE